jgi:hypothetical protein
MGACSSGPSRAGPGRSGSSFVACSLIALRTGSAPSPHASRTSSRSFRSSRISAAPAFRMASPRPHSKTSARGSQNSVVSNPLISNPYSSFFKTLCFSFIYLFNAVPLSVGPCLATLLLVDLGACFSHITLIYDHCKEIPRLHLDSGSNFHVVSMVFYPCNRQKNATVILLITVYRHLEQGANSHLGKYFTRWDTQQPWPTKRGWISR